MDSEKNESCDLSFYYQLVKGSEDERLALYELLEKTLRGSIDMDVNMLGKSASETEQRASQLLQEIYELNWNTFLGFLKCLYTEYREGIPKHRDDKDLSISIQFIQTVRRMEGALNSNTKTVANKFGLSVQTKIIPVEEMDQFFVGRSC